MSTAEVSGRSGFTCSSSSWFVGRLREVERLLADVFSISIAAGYALTCLFLGIVLGWLRLWSGSAFPSGRQMRS
jgi:hypothetical protein